MKRRLEFVRRAADVFFYASLFGMCFSLGAMFVSKRPFRSFAGVMICLIMTCIMSLIYVRVDKLIKTIHEEKEVKKAA